MLAKAPPFPEHPGDGAMEPLSLVRLGPRQSPDLPGGAPEVEREPIFVVLPPPRRGPGVVLDADIGTRFTGPTRAVLVGPELRTTLVYNRWSAGLLARYDYAVAVLQKVPDRFSLSSVSVGLSGGYRLLKAPVELTASVEPSLAAVFMGGQNPSEPEPDVDAHVDMRLGTRFAVAIPIVDRLRAICALGGEGAPAALFGGRGSRRKALPSLPGYMLGLAVGVEVEAIR